MDAHEQAFLDETRAWYGSGEGRDIDARFFFRGHHSTHLHHAARHGWCSAIRWLLVRGANVEATAGQFGYKPLHDAATEGRRDAAVVLLDAGADLNARTLRQSTSLRFAAMWANQEMCKFLLSRGASLDARDDIGQDPETSARVNNKPIVADFLADVRAAGGWSAYVAAPRNQLLALRRELPTLFRTGPCSAPRAQARLFLDKKIPDDVFIHTLTFWRSERDLEPL